MLTEAAHTPSAKQYAPRTAWRHRILHVFGRTRRIPTGTTVDG